ncbi:hypothetical protein SAMN02745823_03092 [Sporobacter termitidis DSM 10068]|uniref:Uncharacterized protein n=1 Tax=Sporobacter termitidis DSM 10068 TaxID=1123282 RepID=A0A1M5Z1M1_9FIRM|nr:hypothetical protein [Sporobacter termitidis]SHI18071.1 hypothetical protein SAMN02745823_03092 [Sporobacter termitidis DSM 10068]
MSGSENIYKPSALSEQRKSEAARSAAVRESAAGNAAVKPKKSERDCDKTLGQSKDSDVRNMSPNATNISHG